MPPKSSIGVNLRVTGHCSQGGRKYMEDFFSIAYQQSEDEKDLEYAFFGIYDGHGGSEAATYAKEHLMNSIVNQKLFWSDCDQDILRAIREGYIATHYAMWREQEKWPKTATGLPSTAGTTASVAFIRRGKIYIGHVGDSGIVLGYQEEGDKCWKAKPLTHDHKPECNVEKARIINSGGKVVTKSGVPRVVWNRPRIGHKGPVRRSTPIDEIPFLAVARSLGDLWSYNSALDEFVVSPDPDVRVVKIDPKTFRCLIFGTDGLWNVLSPIDAVDLAKNAEITNEKLTYMGSGATEWTNPSKCLVDKALEIWCERKMRADNTSVVTIMLDPPGPPRKEMIRNCSATSYGLDCIQLNGLKGTISNEYVDNSLMQNFPILDNSTVAAMYEHQSMSDGTSSNSCTMPTNGYSIMTRYENNCESNFLYYENRNNDIMMPPTNVSSVHCISNNSSIIDSPSSSNNSCHNIELQYMNSFAESYNSLLISSYENDNSNDANINANNGTVGNEIDIREYHTYYSLDESGIIGQDHVLHHIPQTIHQQQQHQYQQQCMSAEDGYSLTKLETRCEQQFRQNDYKDEQENLSNPSPTANSISPFKEFNTESVPYNQYNNITSSYQKTMNALNSDSTNSQSAFDSVIKQNTNEYEEFEDGIDDEDRRFYESNLELTEIDKEYNFTDNKNSLKDGHKANSIENRLLLDESIQINEISSSVIEPVILCIEENDEKLVYSSDIEMKSYDGTNECDIKKTSKTRHSIKAFYQNQTIKNISSIKTKSNKGQKLTVIEQNENISILEPRKLRSAVNCNKRNLRSRDTLSKDMKAKTAHRKQQHIQQQLSQIKRNLNNYLKVSNSSVTPPRTRQYQVQLQQQEQQQINVWSPRQQKRSKNSPTVRRTIADSSLKSNNNNLRNKPKISSDVGNLISSTSPGFLIPSSPSSSSLSSVSSLSSLIVSSSSTILIPSLPSSKRSTTSKNSACCSGNNNNYNKSAVQTRNRVQKRLSH